MKKISFLACLFSLCLLVGCTSIPASKVSFDVDVTYESENPSVTVKVEPFWMNDLMNGTGIGGFNCIFTNNTDKVAKVVWDESSINYNGTSYVPFIEGQKYTNAQEPMSSMAIAKGVTLSKQVYSSAQPHFVSGTYGGWRMYPMSDTTTTNNKVQLIFLIKAKDKEESITINVTTKIQ